MNMSDTSEANELSGTGTPADRQGRQFGTDERVSFRRRSRRWLWHVFARQVALLCVMSLSLARLIGRRRRPVNGDECEIMLTGRFDSDNWILNHIGPLSTSKGCSRLWMVSSEIVPTLPKVSAIYPPKWLGKLVGVTSARLLTFAWAAMRKRPDFVGGFHLIPNGAIAVVIGKLVGARSMYFCVGGPAEISDGGVHSSDSPFGRMETADVVVERRFLKLVAAADMVITMGTKAVTFFRDKGIDTDFHVVSGGINQAKFRVADKVPSVDVILTGRLVPIKRFDIFLQALETVVKEIPDIKALVVGDGMLRSELRSLSVKLGVGHNVQFVGHQENVEEWLRKAKVFVLTSDSEGLSLSMMEAMMSGLPAIVSDVGDLGDLVEDGVNGFLVPRRSPRLFADRMIELLVDDRRREEFGRAARRTALRYETDATIRRWNEILLDGRL